MLRLDRDRPAIGLEDAGLIQRQFLVGGGIGDAAVLPSRSRAFRLLRRVISCVMVSTVPSASTR